MKRETKLNCCRVLNLAGAGRLLMLLCLAWIFGCGTEQVSGQSVGGLRGTVTDSDFQAPINGAQVNIMEAGVSGSTDESGRFVVPGLPPGKYTLAITREGYGRKLVYDVLVSAGSIRDVQVEMVSDVVELDDFVVSSDDLISNDATNLLDVRLNSTSFVDSLGADFISKVGGSDVGDVLKRIVGTSVADSRYVVVRGLSDRYNTVVLNGLRIPSSDPDKRAVNVDIFPSSIVKELANTKTFSPDISGESTGGSINIITKSSPDKPFVNGSLSIGYNTQSTGNSRFVTYHGGGTGIFGTRNERRIPDFLKSSTPATLGEGSSDPVVQENYRKAAGVVNRTTGVDTGATPEDLSFNLSLGGKYEFFGRPLGLLAAFSYMKKYEFDPEVIRGSSTVSQVNSGGQSFRSVFKKNTYQNEESAQSLLSGLLLSAGWEPSEHDTLKLTFFANVAADDKVIFGRGLAAFTNTDEPNSGVEIGNARSVAVREAIQYVERRLKTLQLSGEHHFPDFADAEIRWAAAYSESSQDEPDLRFNTYVADYENGAYAPLSGFSGKPLERIWRTLNDTDYNILLESKVPLFKTADGGETAYVKAGVNFDYSTRDYRADNFGYSNFPVIPVPETLDASNRVALTLGDQLGTLDLDPANNLYLGRIGSMESYDATQSIYAGYGLVNFDLTSQLNINVGARVEAANIRVFRDLSGATQGEGDIDASTALLVDLNTGKLLPPDKVGKANIDEVDVLPALAVTWKLPTEQNMKIKFAASQTVARPSFKELGPVFTRDPGTTSRFVGNIGLQTSDITNLDLRWEWYPSPGDIFAISLSPNASPIPLS